MSLKNWPIAWRISAAVAMPTVGMIAFMVLFVSIQLSTAERMRKVEQISDFAQVASGLIHELQRERGNSAGFTGARGEGAFVQRLADQRDRTDEALQTYRTAAAEIRATQTDAAFLEHLAAADRLLGGMNAHRGAVDRLSLQMGGVVGPYTGMINELIKVIAEETHMLDSGGTTETLIGLISLIHAKESAGIERAVGSNVFSSGAVTPANHRRAFELSASQQTYFAEFREIMGDDWAARLDALLATDAAEAVDAGREVLFEGGYGGSVAAYTGPQWFDLTTRRIDALKDFELEVSNSLIARAQDIGREAQARATQATLAGALVVLLSIAFSVYMTLTVTRPVRRITGYLTRLAAGETDVQIIGGRRKDEIGEMTRAAEAFLAASRANEEMVRNNAALQAKAMKDRAQLLEDMSEQVKEATEVSIGGVAAKSERLRRTSDEMRAALESAEANAREVDQSTGDTLDQTDRAAELAGELTTAIGEVTEQIARGDALARDAVGKAATSRQGVEELREAAHQIGDFVSIISGLSEQTNLLALNATIEAARAGEAGKGFAVVAAEVKELADQTNKSTTEIEQRVAAIRDRTVTAADAIGEIADAIDSLGEVTSAVAAAMEEQRASTGSFAQFVENNRTALSDVAARVQVLAQTAHKSAEDSEAIASQVAELAGIAEEASTSIPEIVNRSIAAARNREDNPRYEVSADVAIRIAGAARQAHLSDLSRTGAALEGVLGSVGTAIELTLHGEAFPAEVAVHRDGQTAVNFMTPLSAEQLEALVARFQSQAA